MELSKTQVDRLGERLRNGSRDEVDLILLDKYRLSFGEAYETVFRIVSEELRRHNVGVEPSGRSAKTKSSIIDKLRRESVRLSQMQDIAGCRIVVPDIQAQDRFLALLKPMFPKADVIDRRANPSHGYRAVHIVVKVDKKPVEIQIRSWLQDLWAAHSEKLADKLDPSIKYGGGDKAAQALLAKTSQLISIIEESECKLDKPFMNALNEVDPKLHKIHQEFERGKKEIFALLKESVIAAFEEFNKVSPNEMESKGKNNDFPDRI